METKTVSGQRVIGLKCIPRNSAGNLVTYPIKGSIVRREKPWKTEYVIWSAKGERDVVFGNRAEDNLVEVPREIQEIIDTETALG